MSEIEIRSIYSAPAPHAGVVSADTSSTYDDDLIPVAEYLRITSSVRDEVRSRVRELASDQSALERLRARVAAARALIPRDEVESDSAESQQSYYPPSSPGIFIPDDESEHSVDYGNSDVMSESSDESDMDSEVGDSDSVYSEAPVNVIDDMIDDCMSESDPTEFEQY